MTHPNGPRSIGYRRAGANGNRTLQSPDAGDAAGLVRAPTNPAERTPLRHATAPNPNAVNYVEVDGHYVVLEDETTNQVVKAPERDIDKFVRYCGFGVDSACKTLTSSWVPQGPSVKKAACWLNTNMNPTGLPDCLPPLTALDNGCGPGGWKEKYAVPDSPLLVDIRGPCSAHDTCYARLGISKSSCDKQLGKDVARTCVARAVATKNLRLLLACPGLGTVYYAAAKALGKDAYADAQRASQRCARLPSTCKRS